MRDYHTVAFTDCNLFYLLQSRVAKFFGDDTYADLNAASYHTLVMAAQDDLNRLQLAKAIAADLGIALQEAVGSSDIMVQSNLYLRAARSGQLHDAIDFHRESMYGASPHAWAVWVPVRNVTESNCLRYIPGSASIPDEQIETVAEEGGAIAKGSAGHKIGLLYAPKRIANLDTSLAKPMLVPEGHCAIFPGSLIHGAGHNHAGKIRFSVDFRLIGREYLQGNKKSFAGNGADYYVPLREAA